MAWHECNECGARYDDNSTDGGDSDHKTTCSRCPTKDDEVRDERDERMYIQGGHMAWLTLLKQAIGELSCNNDISGVELPEAARLVAQLAEIRNALRQLCKEYDCNDWPDNLHLADVIEKHLGRKLQELLEDE